MHIDNDYIKNDCNNIRNEIMTACIQMHTNQVSHINYIRRDNQSPFQCCFFSQKCVIVYKYLNKKKLFKILLVIKFATCLISIEDLNNKKVHVNVNYYYWKLQTQFCNSNPSY